MGEGPTDPMGPEVPDRDDGMRGKELDDWLCRVELSLESVRSLRSPEAPDVASPG